MINFRLVSALIRGDWAIEEQFALNSLPLVEKIINGSYANLPPDELPRIEYSESRASGSQRASGDKVMILPIKGALLKNDGPCGMVGMSTMAGYIRQANKDPDVAGIVLAIDSPGGTIDGTEMLAKTVKNSDKPVVAFIDGLTASAALWIASSAREVMASSPNDQIGSVGAIMRLVDDQPAKEKEGYRFHTLVADQTPDKNKRYLQVLAGDYTEYKKEVLNPIAQIFIDALKANRPKAPESLFTGKMYFVKQVMGDLVDSIGSLEDAVNRVFDLAAKQEPTSKQVISMKQFDRINAALGVDQLEAVDNTVALNEDQLASLEAALSVENPNAGLQDELAAAQAELETANTNLEQARTDLQARNERISELEARVAELETEPGDTGAKIVKKTDGGTSASGEFLSKDDVELFNLVKQ